MDEYIIETSGAEYPFLQIKRELTDAFVRSNPELFLIKDGIVEEKFSCYEIPTYEKPLEEYLSETDGTERWNDVAKSISSFGVPLIIILIYDYLIELAKLLYRFWKTKKKKKETAETES